MKWNPLCLQITVIFLLKKELHQMVDIFRFDFLVPTHEKIKPLIYSLRSLQQRDLILNIQKNKKKQKKNTNLT